MRRSIRRIGAWASDTGAYRFGTGGRAPATVQDRILTVPNLITLSRGLALPVALHLVARRELLAALALFWATAAMDVADGYIARRLNQVSRLGSVLDPVVDRIVTMATALAVAVAGYLPVWLTALVIVRDLLVSGAALYGERIQARVQVTRAGKLGSLFLLFGVPGLLLTGLAGSSAAAGLFCAWALLAAGLPLAYWSMLQYLSQLRAVDRTGPDGGQSGITDQSDRQGI